MRIDFKNACEEIQVEEMSYENCIQILEKLNFINNDKTGSEYEDEMHLCKSLWDKLEQSEPSGVTKKSLLAFLINISNLNPEQN